MSWRDRAATRREQSGNRFLDSPYAGNRFEAYSPFVNDPVPAPRRRTMTPGDGYGYTRGYATSRPQSTAAASRSLSLLNEIRTGVVPALSRDSGDHRAKAMQLANTVLSVFGLRLPQIAWTQGTDAYALGHKIVIGNQLAQSLSLPALTQLLLHEAGHVHEGHADIKTGLLLQALVEHGCLSTPAYNEMMRDEERVADVYAAIGAWMFDPAERPGLATWLAGLGHPETDTHPASYERAQMIESIVRALDAVAFGR